MGNFQSLKTIDYHQARRKDPIVTLWRTVLSVAIEDAIKMKARMIQNEDFWKNKVCTEVLYVTEPNQDFATVCHYADFDHNLIRRKVKETFRKRKAMEKVICPKCRGNGYLKSTGYDENDQPVIEIVQQCENCKSQGEIEKREEEIH